MSKEKKQQDNLELSLHDLKVINTLLVNGLFIGNYSKALFEIQTKLIDIITAMSPKEDDNKDTATKKDNDK